MKSSELQYLWAELIVEELVRNGADRIVLSPGSRNSPIVLAAAENERVRSSVHFDERGAAFYALGYAKATGKPCVLVCTSGTAAANYLPAVVEASKSCVPLIVITADRPIELRDTSANQTIDQIGLFGKYPRWSFDIPSADPSVAAEFVLTTIDQAIYRSLRVPEGPVHLNCQFREPLSPDNLGSVFEDIPDSIKSWFAGEEPYTRYVHNRFIADNATLEEIGSILKESERGVIFAGNLPHDLDPEPLFSFAEAAKMPVLACISSGLRFGSHAHSEMLISNYDLCLSDEHLCRALSPDFTIHLGGPVVSKRLNEYLDNSGATKVVINDTPFREDQSHKVDFRVEMDPGEFCRRMRGVSTDSESALLRPYRKLQDLSGDIISHDDLMQSFTNELSLAKIILKMIPNDSAVFLGNSMPIRDADMCGVTRASKLLVGVNRGASGIDGNVASAVGFAEGNERRLILLIGDLALLHDINSLALVKESSIPITIVVFNNHGGGIFSFLPVTKHDSHFDKFFAASHDFNFKDVSAMFGIDYFCPQTFLQFRDDFGQAVKSTKSCILEVKVDSKRNVAEHASIAQHMIEAVAAELL